MRRPQSGDFPKEIMRSATKSACLAMCGMLLAGCTTFFSSVGPDSHRIRNAPAERVLPAIKVVDVTDDVTRHLLARRSQRLFSETLGSHPNQLQTIGSGDILAVTIWEASPATLFGSIEVDSKGIPAPARSTTLPEQPVDGDGCITVPFAGRVPAAGKTLPEISAEITRRLTGKANQPEVLVLLTRNLSSAVTVVGEVTNSTRVPLTAAHERLLDVLATAAGVRQPVSKTTIQITRGESVFSLPMETIIEDPKQNVAMQPGDVVTALFQPLSFTTLGATGKNDEIPFETQGISLAQALARSGGLIDQRSNARGVFVFRLEPKDAVATQQESLPATVGGLVPVVYRVDLGDPRGLFLIQSFPIQDRDVLYVSNAPVAEMQKFLNLLVSLSYPLLTGKQLGL